MKRNKVISTAILSIFSMLLSSGCASTNPEESKIKEIYALAKESGFKGTYEEWLSSIRGEDGKDGHSPKVEIGDNGNWFIDGTDTGIKAKGEDGTPGKDGEDGKKGPQGDKGEQGEPGKDGRSIISIDLTSTEGNADVYTIRYSDETTSIFKVTNGKDGEAGSQGIQGEPGKDGHTPIITIGSDGNWIVDGVNSNIKAQGPKGDKGEQGKPGKDGKIYYSNSITIKGKGRVFTKQGSYSLGEVVEFVFEPEIGYELGELRINNETINLSMDKKYTHLDGNNSSYKTIMIENGFFLEAEFVETTKYLITTPTEVNFWSYSVTSVREEMMKQIRNLKQIEPNLSVKLKNIGNYKDLEKEIRASQYTSYSPNLVILNYLVNQDVDTVDCTKYIDDSRVGFSPEEKDDFKPGYIVKSPINNNKTLGLELHESSDVMFYNETAIEELVRKVPELSVLNENNIQNLSFQDFIYNVCPLIKNYNSSLPTELKLYDDSRDGSGILSINFDFNFFKKIADLTGGYSTNINGEPNYLFNNDRMMNLLIMIKEGTKNGYITDAKSKGLFSTDLFKGKASLFTIEYSSGMKYAYSPNFRTNVTRVPFIKSSSEPTFSVPTYLSVIDAYDENINLASWVAAKYFTNSMNSYNLCFDYGYSFTRKSHTDKPEYKAKINELLNGYDIDYLLAKTYIEMNRDKNIKPVPYAPNDENRSRSFDTFVDWYMKNDFTKEQLKKQLDDLIERLK